MSSLNQKLFVRDLLERLTLTSKTLSRSVIDLERKYPELGNRSLAEYLEWEYKLLKSAKPKKWSRKGRCPICSVKTGSNHSKGCSYKY